MIYVIFDNSTIGGKKVTEKISNELYLLTRPESTRDEYYLTDKIFRWIQHPVTGQLAIEWREDYVLNLHNLKNSGQLINLYAQINKSGVNKELKEIKNLIDNNATINAGQLISKDMITKTHSEMEAEGWFSIT